MNELIERTINLALENRDRFCISLVQCRFRVGYTIAAKTVEILEQRGIVGPYDRNTGFRPVLINSLEEARNL